MIKIEEILVPEIVPNNLRQIRTLRGLSIEELSRKLNLTNSYLKSVENNKANLSGITLLRLMKILDANFYQFYDINDSVILPVRKEITEEIQIEMNIRKEYLYLSDIHNIPKIEKLLTEELKKNNIQGDIFKFAIISTKDIDESISNVVFKIELKKRDLYDKLFDIKLLKELNYELFKHLNELGFKENKSLTIKNKNDYKIIDEKVYIINKDLVQKILNGKDTYRLDEVEVIYTNNTNISQIKVNYTIEKMTNIQYIQDYLNLSNEDMSKALAIGKTACNNIKTTSQKLSLKIMWKLVKLFKVPLEVILNIPLYLEKANK